MNTTPRVRFAPSPTGALHIGGVRTALYNYLFARRHGGTMILRIEDTDTNRYVEGAEKYIIDSLQWLGIEFDEGVSFGGKHAPYRQSERKDIYRKYVDRLIADGKAYYAFDTPEELEEKRSQTANFQYDASTRMSMNNSLVLPADEVSRRIANGEKYVVRIRIEPNEEIVVNDIIRGEVDNTRRQSPLEIGRRAADVPSGKYRRRPSDGDYSRHTRRRVAAIGSAARIAIPLLRLARYYAAVCTSTVTAQARRQGQTQQTRR